MLKFSGIRDEEVREDPQAVLGVLEMASDGPKPVVRPSRGNKKLADLLRPEDPEQIFTNLKKLDEGYECLLCLSFGRIRNSHTKLRAGQVELCSEARTRVTDRQWLSRSFRSVQTQSWRVSKMKSPFFRAVCIPTLSSSMARIPRTPIFGCGENLCSFTFVPF